MAEPTVFEMEIEGVVHPIEDKTARAGVLVPELNTEGEITALKDSENVSFGLADTVARQKLEKLQAYSTTEQDTGQVWLDGRKVYKRVVNYEETTIHGASGFGFALATGIRTLVSHCLYRADLALPVGMEGAAIPVQAYMTGLEAYWYVQTLYVMPSGALWFWTEGNNGILRVYGEIYYTKLSE